MDPHDYLESMDCDYYLSPYSEAFTTPSETEATSQRDSLTSPCNYPSTRVFTCEEDEILKRVAGEMDFDWPRIARLLQNKTPAQAAKRWACRLDPSIKKSRWTAEEDHKIAQLQAIHGNNWRLIAKELTGRPCAAIKSRYYNAIKNRADMQILEGESGLDSTRRIRQMECGGQLVPALLVKVTDKNARVTALRKQLITLEQLMTQTKAEFMKLHGESTSNTG